MIINFKYLGIIYQELLGKIYKLSKVLPFSLKRLRVCGKLTMIFFQLLLHQSKGLFELIHLKINPTLWQSIFSFVFSFV